MPTLPLESPAQDVRNALTLLLVAEETGQPLTPEDRAATIARLWSAVHKLESPDINWCPRCAYLARDL